MGTIQNKTNRIQSKSTNTGLLWSKVPQTFPSKVDLRFNACAPYFPAFYEISSGSSAPTSVISAWMCGNRRLNPGKTHYMEPSISYNYYYARTFDGSTFYDSGTNTESSLKAGKKYGMVSKHVWPNTESFNARPPESVEKSAKTHHIKKYQKIVPTLTNLKETLRRGFPVIMTLGITDTVQSWLTDRSVQISTDFLMEIPEFHADRILKFHTVLIIGYDDSVGVEGAFLIRNTWGPNWGENGHFWMSYDDTVYPELSGPFWIILEQNISTNENKTDTFDSFEQH